jgi:hypothetical protein
MSTIGNVRVWAALTALFGVVALAVSVGFGMLPAAKAAADCPGAASVLPFEMARTAQDLTAIFGSPGDACRPKAVAAMDAINHLDTAAFIWTYGGFMGLAALYLARGALRPLTLAAVAAALGAIVADYVETFNLLAITRHGVDDAVPMLATSANAATIKFVLIGANALCLAAQCFTSQPSRRIVGALLVLPALGVALFLYDHAQGPAQTIAIVLGWLPLIAVAARDAVRRRA